MFEPVPPFDAVLEAGFAVPDARPAVDFALVPAPGLAAGRVAVPVCADTGAVFALDAFALLAADFGFVAVLPTVDFAEVDVVLPTVSAAVAGARRAAWLAVERAGFAAPGTAEVRVSAPGLARRTPAVDETGAGRVARR